MRRRCGWYILEFDKDGVYNKDLGELAKGSGHLDIAEHKPLGG